MACRARAARSAGDPDAVGGTTKRFSSVTPWSARAAVLSAFGPIETRIAARGLGVLRGAITLRDALRGVTFPAEFALFIAFLAGSTPAL